MFVKNIVESFFRIIKEMENLRKQHENYKLTKENKKDFNNSTKCNMCNKAFSNEKKVRSLSFNRNV